jgi:hypothetical protein
MSARSDRKTLLQIAAIAMFTFLVGSAGAAQGSEGRTEVAILWSPQGAPNEDALWLGYLTARANYINGHKAAYDWKPGIVIPSFGEELAARTLLVQIYRELKQKDGQLNSAYVEDLTRVADQSFLGEYVWTYLHQSEWGPPRGDLRLVDFMHWRAANLAQHAVITKGNIRFAVKGEATAILSEKTISEAPLLLEGRKVLEHGDTQLAIAGYFDPVIEHFERTYRDSGKRVYAARNLTQALIYAALPNEDKKPGSGILPRRAGPT